MHEGLIPDSMYWPHGGYIFVITTREYSHMYGKWQLDNVVEH